VVKAKIILNMERTYFDNRIYLKMFKPITKERNRKTILVYYALAIIFISIGLATQQVTWNVMGAAILGLALFRKYFLMKRLKG